MLLLCVLDDMFMDRQAGYLDFPILMTETKTILSQALAAQPVHFAALCKIIGQLAEADHISAAYQTTGQGHLLRELNVLNMFKQHVVLVGDAEGSENEPETVLGTLSEKYGIL